jgi:hypothetical protein
LNGGAGAGERFESHLIYAILAIMKTTIDQRDKLEADGGMPDAGHAAWMRAKIERGLAQTEDRDAMIPIEHIWRDLKLDR